MEISLSTPETTNRISWDETEMDELAAAWVRARLLDPHIPSGTLLEKTQERVLAESRRRTIAGFSQVPDLKKKVDELWIKTVNAEPPPPRVIEIPFEAPVNFADLATRLDNATLGAIVISRMESIFRNSHPQPETNGNGHGHGVKQMISVIAEASKPAIVQKSRSPRIAICTTNSRLYKQAMTDVDKFKINVELRFVDLDQRGHGIPAQCDFVIFPENPLETSGEKRRQSDAMWKAARAAWPTSRVFNCGADVNAIIQKCRDITSMKTNLAGS